MDDGDRLKRVLEGTHAPSFRAAEKAAIAIRKYLKMADAETDAETGIVLGTGWGGRVRALNDVNLSLTALPGFSSLSALPGHARTLRHGSEWKRNQDTSTVHHSVLTLDGRVHMNEAPYSADIAAMVRLQIQMLAHLGINRLVLTCAAGSLSPHVPVGSIVVVDGFVTLWAPDMPLYAGEFCSPEDALDESFSTFAGEELSRVGFDVYRGGYAMVRGPFFEGRRYDKKTLADTGALAVGMSMLPEACVASLYGVAVTGLCFITNAATDEHSHAENVRRVRDSASGLGDALLNIIVRAPR